MAERSVQGRIHSVFQNTPPIFSPSPKPDCTLTNKKPVKQNFTGF